jgi:hypothetical protein
MNKIALIVALLAMGCAGPPTLVRCHGKPVHLRGGIGGLAIYENGAYDKCLGQHTGAPAQVLRKP